MNERSPRTNGSLMPATPAHRQVGDLPQVDTPVSDREAKRCDRLQYFPWHTKSEREPR